MICMARNIIVKLKINTAIIGMCSLCFLRHFAGEAKDI